MKKFVISLLVLLAVVLPKDSSAQSKLSYSWTFNKSGVAPVMTYDFFTIEKLLGTKHSVQILTLGGLNLKDSVVRGGFGAVASGALGSNAVWKLGLCATIDGGQKVLPGLIASVVLVPSESRPTVWLNL